MKSLAVIPARGGSKRIPRKNIKLFLGKPIIAWPIEIALESGLFDEVMVSTEDGEIAEIAQQYGAKVPFMRSSKNSDDNAGTENVVLEVLDSYLTLGKQFDVLCCIYPTTPLITSERLTECRAKLLNQEFDTVLPVLRFGHPVQRALKIFQNKVQMVWPENEHMRTQDMDTYFHDAGQFYWLKVNEFLQRKLIYSPSMGCVTLSEMEAQDIDNLDDWRLAELKFKINRQIAK